MDLLIETVAKTLRVERVAVDEKKFTVKFFQLKTVGAYCPPSNMVNRSKRGRVLLIAAAS